ncbi:TfoX N-terminal domain-containing protein [Nannocystis exedens]|uniref:TfoX N-terminal domain-containing protein n=1 Tax=Nannocystis exedens TaxID=54 RepID=A0A1I2EPR6_9BACT|nr:TfoX/Sxy family protein [Nannocystis exedens]PCC73913.1 RNA methyltransferase [Nannocystis exedens]SFE94331.1 TfoX N-terminal domain-containing protein [Nannocystis exedens]
MPYDHGVASRLRTAVMRAGPQGLVEERKMFGGVALLLDGSIAWGVLRSDLVIRVTDTAAALGRPHARPFDFTGRPSRGLVYVAPPGYAEAADLDAWVALGIAGARAPIARSDRLRARGPRESGRARDEAAGRRSRVVAAAAPREPGAREEYDPPRGGFGPRA